MLVTEGKLGTEKRNKIILPLVYCFCSGERSILRKKAEIFPYVKDRGQSRIDSI